MVITAAVITNRNTVQYQKQLKDLVRVVKQELHEQSQPTNCPSRQALFAGETLQVSSLERASAIARGGYQPRNYLRSLHDGYGI